MGCFYTNAQQYEMPPKKIRVDSDAIFKKKPDPDSVPTLEPKKPDPDPTSL